MSSIALGAGAPAAEGTLGLVIHGQSHQAPPQSNKAAGGGTSAKSKRGKAVTGESVSHYVLSKGGVWSAEASGPEGLITMSEVGQGETYSSTSEKQAVPAMNKVLIEDVLVAARSANSLEFKTPTPLSAEFLIRMASMLDSDLLPRLAVLSKQAFEDSVAALLRNIAPPLSMNEAQMAQRVAIARATILEEFGYFTREQLAKHSRARDPRGLIDTWRSRGKVFAVSLPQSTAKDADVYLSFQFSEGKPLPIIGSVIRIFGKSLNGWEMAHWFTSGNSMLPDSSRPVDLLESAPADVEAAARFDALPPAA